MIRMIEPNCIFLTPSQDGAVFADDKQKRRQRYLRILVVACWWMLIRMMRKAIILFFSFQRKCNFLDLHCLGIYTFTQPELPFGDYKTYKTGHFAASQFDYDNKFFSTMVARKVPLLLFLYSSSSVGGGCASRLFLVVIVIIILYFPHHSFWRKR